MTAMQFATCPHCGQTFELPRGEDTPLRRARLEKGLSIQKASDEIGMSQWTLSQMERGGGNPKLSVLKKLSTYYGKSIDELFPEPPESDDADEFVSENGALDEVVGELEAEDEDLDSVPASIGGFQ